MIIGFDASRAFGNEKTGTEHYSYQLLKNLLAIDSINTYKLYLRKNSPPDGVVAAAPNIKRYAIPLPKLLTQLGLMWEVLENPPDVLFIPAHTLPVIHRPSLKSIVTIHDLGAEYLPQYHKFPQKLYLNRSTEFAVKFATHLIAVSEATKHDLIKRLKANPDKISVVYEGYDTEHFVPQSETKVAEVKKKYNVQGPYLFFVGTIQPRKNLERLIEAFARVKTDHTLVLGGKKGWLSEPIYAAPKKFGTASKVQFIDYVDWEDLPGLYAGATAFTFPSLFEGFGLPVLEAMACGTPVVTSNSSSLPEVAGDAAVIVDPTNTSAIENALADILSNPKKREELRTRGFEQAKKFTWQNTAHKTLEVFEKVYGKS